MHELTGQPPQRPLAVVLAVFGSVGIAATLFYFTAAAVLSAVLPVSAVTASIAAYAMAAVLSYLGHKRLSFASAGAHAIEVPRFLATTAVGLLIAWLLPLATGQLGWPAVVGYAGVCGLVPVLNFVLLRDWVFRVSRPGPTEMVETTGNDPLLAAAGVALFVLAFAVQSLVWQTNTDTSWLLTVIDKMHAGEQLYADIIELNSPSSVWLYLAPMHLSYLTGLPAEVLLRAYVLLVCAGGVLLTGWIIRAGDLMPARAIPAALAMLFLSGTILVGNAFTERDQIGVVLVAPLIALAAWRGTSAGNPPRWFHWLAAGCAGGVIAIVKPYYALVVVAAAAWLVIRRRDIRLFFLPEFLVSGAMCLAYLAAFYLLYPVYFERLLPVLSETYLAFRWPVGQLAMLAAPWLAIPVAYILLAKRGGRSVLAELFLLCAAAALAPYFIQGKGWAYHAYAATYLGAAALIISTCGLLFGAPAGPSGRNARLEIAGIALVGMLVAHLRFFDSAGPSEDLAAQVRAEFPSASVGILGGEIADGHPFARMIGGRWVEPYCSDWLPTYAARMARQSDAAGDQSRSDHYRRMLDTYFEDKLERLTASPPDILIVSETDGIVRLMLERHGFGALLGRYVKFGADGDLAVYRHVRPAGSRGEASG